jgi:hypothetical protein
MFRSLLFARLRGRFMAAVIVGSSPAIDDTIRDAPAVLEYFDAGFIWRVPRCPYCSKTHTHGAGLVGENPVGYLSHKSSSCFARALNHGYMLIDLEPAKTAATIARARRRFALGIR